MEWAKACIPGGEMDHGKFQWKAKPKSAASAVSGNDHATWRDGEHELRTQGEGCE